MTVGDTALYCVPIGGSLSVTKEDACEMLLRQAEEMTSVRVALWIRIVTAGQLAELSRLTFCTFQLISMEPHLPGMQLGKERSSLFSQFLLINSPDSLVVI